jgi:hypothetical protein
MGLVHDSKLPLEPAQKVHVGQQRLVRREDDMEVEQWVFALLFGLSAKTHQSINVSK